MGGEESGGSGKKLREGVRVALLTPEWDRSCSTCETFATNSDGSFLLNRRTGLPMLREKHQPTPCHKCEKVPASVRRMGVETSVLRAAAIELSEANRQAWSFYRECRAVGEFPADGLVRWYASILREVEEECEQVPMHRLAANVGSLVELLKKRIR